MNDNFEMVAKTLYGFEKILENELIQLGAIKTKIGNRSVSFFGDKGFMYKCNLALRTAIKILKPIKKFYANNEHELYDEIMKIPWNKYIGHQNTLSISSTVNSNIFTHSKYVIQKTKDSIVDQFKKLYGSRPSIDIRHPDLKINIHIDKNKCTVSLDSSGESLHKRGYKISSHIAPINEVMAAGILIMSGWQGKSDLIDPMCGSGTFLIEAAMIAFNIPPNLMRAEFGFEKWKDWDNQLFQKIHESLLSKKRIFKYKIIGYDKSISAVKSASINIQNCNLEDFISLNNIDFFKTKKENNDKLFLVFNPPYGERLKLNIRQFYVRIGNTLKHNYTNSLTWLISSNLESLKYIGLKPSKKIKLYNGKLETRLVCFDIYTGSKKSRYRTKNTDFDN